LEQVTAGVGTETQTLKTLAKLEPGRVTAGWDNLELFPFTNPGTQDPAVLELGGKMTLRLSMPGGNHDIDYLAFVPVVPRVPTVTLAPTVTSVVAGQTLSLMAGIAGENISYRWQKDGVDLQASTRIAGVTSQTLTIQGVTPSDAGSYRLTANGSTGSATTLGALVTVLTPVTVTQQPQSVVGVEGTTVQFSVTATGSPSPTYQWFKDGNPLPGATEGTLNLASVRPAMIGDYTAVVSNAAGSVTSSGASLTIQGVDSGIWKGLVAYYPFNGNAKDESGNPVNSLIANSADLFSDRFSRAGSSYLFNGLSQKITQSVPYLPVGDLKRSLSVWFKSDGQQKSIYRGKR